MRVVIGGAYNGKREYVKKILSHIDENDLHFFEGEIPQIHFSKKDYIVIGNFDRIIEMMPDLDEVEIANLIFDKLNDLDKFSNVICICTDIGRGIVPIEAGQRKIRDTCGRLYQKLFEECETVIRIWYGIPQYLKGDIEK